MSDKQNKIMLDVIKRNGRKVDFDASKIALAIKKGFDDVNNQNDGEESKTIYTSKDVNKVYLGVLKNIEKKYKNETRIKIEEIQDLIEIELDKQGYDEVQKSFAEYRERRAQSREAFSSDKKIHKFLKTLEGLGLKSANEDDTKRENANIDGDSSMGTMLQYGSTVSKEFAKAYLMKKKFSMAHDEGDIHIHDMDFLAMGTTTCMQIELDRLFKKGFSTGHGHLRTPASIASYSALAAIAIQSNQNDQHGGQSIPAFDYYMAPGVLKTFKKEFKQQIYDLLEYEDLLSFINMDKISRDIDKLNSIDLDLDMFKSSYSNSKKIRRLFEMSYDKAIAKTDRQTYQAMEAFIHNLNTMHSRAGAQVPFSSINFGTDTSVEGRMVIKNFLEATEAGLGKGETPIFPVSIFKVKEGVNYNKEDPNYDLFKLACKVSAKRLFPNFSFIDAPFNITFYKEGDYRTEVGYMGCRTRVMSDITDPNNQTTGGRGNLSFTSINLPRIAIKHGICLKERDKADMKGFYEDLEEMMDLVKDQLLERFEIQCNKRVYNFPFLLGAGVWTDGDKLKPTDRLRKILDLGLVDYVAMDVKAPFDKYKDVIKADIGQKVKESMEIVNEYEDIILECRTTYCPKLLSEEDLFTIVDEVDCDLYTIQQFRNRCVLDESLAEAEEPNPHDMEAIAKRIKEAHPDQDINIKTAEFGQRSI